MTPPFAPAPMADLLAQLGPAAVAAVVSLLPVDLLLAVRVGAEVAALRADHQLAELLGADYPGGAFYRQHDLAELTELQRLRYPPTGDRDLWIKYGPDGPPLPDTLKKAA